LAESKEVNLIGAEGATICGRNDVEEQRPLRLLGEPGQDRPKIVRSHQPLLD
jgi:hypothetical protein